MNVNVGLPRRDPPRRRPNAERACSLCWGQGRGWGAKHRAPHLCSDGKSKISHPAPVGCPPRRARPRVHLRWDWGAKGRRGLSSWRK